MLPELFPDLLPEMLPEEKLPEKLPVTSVTRNFADVYVLNQRAIYFGRHVN